jgi:hypothetical protein
MMKGSRNLVNLEVHLPASLDAIRQEAAMMFAELDRQRARLFVQQIANKHGNDEPFEVRPDGKMVTYADRIKELDEAEANLHAGLPPAVVEAIKGQNGNGGSEE